MHELIDDLKIALPAVFESEDYQTRRSAIDEAFQKKQGEAFSALRDKAAEKNIVILRTPIGFALAPAQDGQVVPPDEFSAWPEEKRARGAGHDRGAGEGSGAYRPPDSRNGRSSGATRCASSIATPRSMPSTSRSTRPRPSSATCRASSSTSKRYAPTWSRTSPSSSSRAKMSESEPRRSTGRAVRSTATRSTSW